MSDNILVSRSRPADAYQLNIRECDAQELEANNGKPWVETVRWSIEFSQLCWTVRERDEVLCIFGLGGTDSPLVGCPWMVCSDAVARHRVKTLRVAREVVQRFLREYPRLANYVDARNQAAIRWLRLLGARFETTTLRGPQSLPFILFSFGNPNGPE